MKSRIITTLLLLAVAFGVGQAQSRKDLRINEVMVVNDSSIVDDYGRHSAWIELFNTAYAPVEISKVFITNDTLNPTKYSIPLGDVKTRIPKRQHVVFWADSRPGDGTFHVSFSLTPGRDNVIALYDADTTLIDKVVVPATLASNATYARVADGAEEWEIRDNTTLRHNVSPSSANLIKEGNEKAEKFARNDPNGFAMTIMAMAIVFGALLALCIAFYIVSRIGAAMQRRNKATSAAKAPGKRAAAGAESRPANDSGEEIAAIVMALHEHFNVHDQESTILTLKKLRRAYSPWSSKIYGMRSR